MIEQALAVIESSALATSLRHSTWVYPLVNAGHILGVALLVGGVIPMDLRLLGIWRTHPLVTFVRVLRVTSALGLGLAVVCGLLLFSTAATDYAGSTLFRIKVLVVFLGLLNAWFVGRMLSRHAIASLPLEVEVNMPLSVRAGALASLLLWVTALVLGRLLGYF